MSDFPLEFEVVEKVEDAAFTALQALVPRFDLATSGSQKIRRTWLDTFDWRLYQSGLVLEHSEAGGQHRLTMTSETGERLSSSVACDPLARQRRSAPRVSASRPLGQRRRHPCALAGRRRSEQRPRSPRVERRRQDGGAGRVGPADEVPGRSGKSPAAHLSVVPLRGYDSQADQVARILSRAPGVQASRGSVFEQALAAASREPRDYVSKIDIPLSPSMSAPLAVAAVLETFLGTMEANLSGVHRGYRHGVPARLPGRRPPDTRPHVEADRRRPSRLDGGSVRAGIKWLGDLTTRPVTLTCSCWGSTGWLPTCRRPTSLTWIFSTLIWWPSAKGPAVDSHAG